MSMETPAPWGARGKTAAPGGARTIEGKATTRQRAHRRLRRAHRTAGEGGRVELHGDSVPRARHCRRPAVSR